MELTVHNIDEGAALATYGPIVIRVITTAPTDLPSLERAFERVDAALERWPEVGMWVIAHHGAPVPDAAARRFSNRAMRERAQRVSFAFTMLGLGFWATAARTATLAMLKLLGDRNTPIEATVEAAAEQLCMDLIGPDPAQLVAVHETLIARMRVASVA